ncbi:MULTISPECIES: ASCH domain-containing protein [unclassified Enterococcus]|uniref:ASCH domain-containing protein n=1 Tax=unclassified Enterococcus TaxID=2608891 RepID=UPI001CE20385|nr:MULTISPECIES: ASCH domain-containing protein [unclassified Enterococcus]MCA5011468.1 ASCH domain-containing protein [Enterococcus sp. S23]MCA5015090.1 ASCH domain-containing protein [Enterococcus sp. S22(2020)]
MEKIKGFWEKFLLSMDMSERPTEMSYSVWHFLTEDPKDAAFANELAELVRSGEKTATTTLPLIYQINAIPYPEVGSYHLITTFEGEPKAIVQAKKITLVPYQDVSQEHVFKEAEGDRSIEQWQRIHQRFFADLLTPYNRIFSTDMTVMCIEFDLVFK